LRVFAAVKRELGNLSGWYQKKGMDMLEKGWDTLGHLVVVLILVTVIQM
jgi:hypothetical protein